MFKNLKQKLNILRTKNAKPIITLNDADKVYLACARSDDALFSYVLALVCTRQGNTGYFNLLPQTEVFTFNSRAKADAFYGTVQQVSRMQSMGKVSNLFSAMEQEIKAFNNKTR